MLLIPFKQRIPKQNSITIQMGAYFSSPTKNSPHTTKTRNYDTTETQSKIFNSPQKKRIFTRSEKSQKPILFLTVSQQYDYLELTEQGQQFLMGIPNKRDIAFVINYGTRRQYVHRILKGELDQYYSEQDQTKIYLSTIGHCDNSTALLLDWKGRFNPHIFSILLSISSLIVFSTFDHKSHTIDDVAELIPASCVTIQALKKLNKASTLPTFLWLQQSLAIHPYQLDQQQINDENNNLLAKKRRFDVELFKQAFRSMRIQQYQSPSLYLGYDQDTKKAYDFEKKKIYDQLRIKILRDLNTKAISSIKITPNIALCFINQFKKHKFLQETVESSWANIQGRLSIEIRKKIFCLINTERARLATEGNKRQIAKGLKKNLIPLITEFKKYHILDQKVFLEYFESQLKVFQLYINDHQQQQSDKREHYLSDKNNYVVINVNLIAEGIEQKAIKSNENICQVLYEERKRLQSQGSNYSAYSRRVYLDNIRSYFEQRMREQLTRLEKENTAKVKMNAALTTKKEKIKEKKANLNQINKSPTCWECAELYNQFQLMNKEDQESFI